MTLSIILVNYKSCKDLKRCLPALFGQEQDAEILVVDNSPGDGTAEWLAANYPQVRLIPNANNTGYAGGNNLGIAHATREWVLILNPDTELQPGALEALLSVARQNPDSLITPKLLNPDGTVNACGLEMHYTGITTCRGLGDESDRYAGTFRVPLVSGAAFLAPKWLLSELGGFGANYFMYLEDADLSIRARAKGYAILCAADAVVMHDYMLAMSPTKFYYLERNRLLTLFKLYQTRTLYRMAGALLLTEFATWAFALLKGPRYLSKKGAGYLWLWRNREEWLAARRAFQDARILSDEELLEEVTTALPFDQLVTSRALANFLGRITQPFYTLLRPVGSITRARV